jgi:hypothetical protein
MHWLLMSVSGASGVSCTLANARIIGRCALIVFICCWDFCVQRKTAGDGVDNGQMVVRGSFLSRRAFRAILSMPASGACMLRRASFLVCVNLPLLRMQVISGGGPVGLMAAIECWRFVRAVLAVWFLRPPPRWFHRIACACSKGAPFVTVIQVRVSPACVCMLPLASRPVLVMFVSDGGCAPLGLAVLSLRVTPEGHNDDVLAVCSCSNTRRIAHITFGTS